MQEISWSDADASRLKMLRLEAGYDLAQFSKLSSVSIAQITQLEESGDSLFYSPRIKYSVGKRLTLLLLKSQHSLDLEHALIDEKIRKSEISSQSQINAIAELSRRDLDATPIKDFLGQLKFHFRHFLVSKYVLSSLAMLMVMSSVWIYEHHGEQEIAAAHFAIESKWAQSAFVELSHQWDELSAAFSSRNTFFAAHEDVSQEPHALAGLNKPDLPSLLSPSNTVLTQPVASAEAPPAIVSEEGCSFGLPGPEISPTAAHKPGNYVYLVALANTMVCLKDGQDKINKLNLLAGATQTVLGSPPWRVSLKGIEEAKIFYQGQRIQPPASGEQVFTLVEYKP